MAPTCPRRRQYSTHESHVAYSPLVSPSHGHGRCSKAYLTTNKSSCHWMTGTISLPIICCTRKEARRLDQCMLMLFIYLFSFDKRSQSIGTIEFAYKSTHSFGTARTCAVLPSRLSWREKKDRGTTRT